MKNRFLFVSTMALTALFLTSCDWTKKPWASATDGSEDTDSISAKQYCTAEFNDSISINEATAYQELRVDFPAEDDSSAVAQAVLAWLCDEVRSRCFPSFEGERIDSAFAVDTDNPELDTFADNVVTTYGRKGLQRLGNELREMANEGYEGFFGNNLAIELAEQTENYLTFTLEHDVYMGGAHGGQYHEGRSFRTSDGKAFTWKHFKTDMKPELIALLKKGLMAYFNEGADEPITTEAALFEMLLLYDDPDTPENELEYGLPLPATDPWLTRDGVVFIYQEYEIAPYAFGRPSVTLPYSAVADFITPEGMTFVNGK